MFRAIICIFIPLRPHENQWLPYNQIMIKFRKFVFNSFMVNTYILSDESGECIIIDAACHGEQEQNEVTSYIAKNNLKLVRNVNTHCHVDHVLGNGFIFSAFGIAPEYHRASAPFFYTLKEIGESLGFVIGNIPQAKGFLEDGDLVKFGASSLEVLYTPGHADGSVCFYNPEQNFVITGDVLFRDSIGRTDLPTGDYNLLMKSIKEKLFILPETTVVYPGHGPETTIGFEMTNNPFIR
jgi:hydroxyacylglutathione hydrolase